VRFKSTFSPALILGLLSCCTQRMCKQQLPPSPRHAGARRRQSVVAPGHEFSIGLHFQLEKGWHIYWINPGDSGEPPRVTWQLPAGLTAEAMVWPAPRRLATSSIVDFGYEDAVMLIAPMHAAVNLPARVRAGRCEVRLLVCREMCIPGNVDCRSPADQIATPAPDAQSMIVCTGAQVVAAPLRELANHCERRERSLCLRRTWSSNHTGRFSPLAESQIDNAAPQKLQPKTICFRLELRKSIGFSSDRATEGCAGAGRRSRLLD